MIDFILKFTKFIAIPVTLLLFWIIASLLFNPKVSFSTLLFKYPDSSILNIHQGRLLAGEKYSGEFTSPENYLGIIRLQFEKFDKTDFRKEDILNFRIREKGKKTWYFESTYRSGLIHDSLYFPFGFPPMQSSKNKLYEFELISQKGSSSHAIELSRQNFVLASYHVIPRNEITSSNSKLISFTVRKIINSYTDLDFIFSSWIFSVPLFLYILFFTFRLKVKNIITSSIFIRVFFVFMMLDTFLLDSFYLGIFIEMALLWVLAVFYLKAEGLVSFFAGFLLISLWVFLLIFGFSQFTYKLNLWVYTFFVIGAVQFIVEEVSKRKDRLLYKDFVKKILKV